MTDEDKKLESEIVEDNRSVLAKYFGFFYAELFRVVIENND